MMNVRSDNAVNVDVPLILPLYSYVIPVDPLQP